LRELVCHEQQKRLLALQGRIDWDGGLDAMRTDIPAAARASKADEDHA
jgi:hypothetical protein